MKLLFPSSRIQRNLGKFSPITFRILLCEQWWFLTVLRPTPEATVSAPLEWSEVKKGINPSDFNIFNVVKRKSDPWKNIFEKKCKLEI